MNRSVVEEEAEAPLSLSAALQPRAAASPATLYRDLLGASRAEEGARAEQVLAVIDNFQELMKCFMCLSKVREPVLCPACSKFACELCLRSWIIDRKPECPVCRRPLALSQLVKVRFLNEFARIIEVLGKARPSAGEEGRDAELCEEHGSAMSYYCLTCYRSVCSDCVVITKRHDGHSLEKIRVVYERKLEAICAELASVGQRAAEQKAHARELAGKLELLKRAKEEKVDELMNAYRLMKTKLDNDFALRSQRLLDEKRRVEEGVEAFEAASSDVCAQIKAGSAVRTIGRACDYLKTLSELGLHSAAAAAQPCPLAGFGLDVSVRPAEGVFLLRDYARRRAANDIVFSPPLLADGITWRVKVYPNGTGIYKGTYLSLFVEMVKGWEGGGTFYYKVVLVKPRCEAENVERDYTSDFENSICWGYNRFCKLEDLEAQGFLAQDQITLRYFIRPANHFQKLRDQAHHIRQLEEELRRREDPAPPAEENPFLRAAAQHTLADLAGSLNLNLLFLSEGEQGAEPPPAEPPRAEEGCGAAERAEGPLSSSLIRISDVNEDSAREDSGRGEE